MRKEIVEVYCDSCGVNCEKDYLKHNCFELCHVCVRKRLQLSHNVIPIGAKCGKCKGEKGHKEFHTYGSDYEWKQCTHCQGTGYEPILHS